MTKNTIILPNAAYNGQRPRKLQAVCHDRSPFLTIECSCSAAMHIHETQIEHAPDGAELETRCMQCGHPIVLSISEIKRAFQTMRDDGWID